MNIYMLIDEKPYGSNVYAFSTKKAAQDKMRKLLKAMIPLMKRLSEDTAISTMEHLLPMTRV